MLATHEPKRQMNEAEVAACRQLLRNGSRSFYAASFLLPRRVRDPAAALYSFCRIADDAIDVAQGDRAAIDMLHRRIATAYRGDCEDELLDTAFSATVRTFAIPAALPLALIEGFSWDVEARRYQTLDELLDYAARVAGSVGAMMCVVMGRRDAKALARACDLGVAMQLTNIARDVGEDARAGRLYLPLQWFEDEAIDVESWMANPVPSEGISNIIRRLLSAADTLYARADYGISMLPLDCQRGIRAARLLYAAIGHEVMRRDCDSVTSRAVVTPRRKLALVGSALKSGKSVLGHSDFPPLKANRFMVDAVLNAPSPIEIANPSTPKWWDVRGQAVQLIELFAALETRNRERMSSDRAPRAPTRA
jgi:15-cis-phytoene synthase